MFENPPLWNEAGLERAPRLLLRSSWQAVNIGDIGHTPGVLSLLERYLPEAHVTLWSNLEKGAERDALVSRFPQLQIVRGGIGEDGLPDNEELLAVMRDADFLIHGSGPGLVALKDLEFWRDFTGKPYGIYGVTLDPLGRSQDDHRPPGDGDSLAIQRKRIEALSSDHLDECRRRIINEASFFFCRDTLTLLYLQNQNLTCDSLDFAPDGAFGIDLREDAPIDKFLREHGLKTKDFISVIPRLRYTPYHEIHGRNATLRDTVRVEVSERFRERDFALMREVVVQWVRKTGLKVLLCPEMTYQVALGKSQILNRLPVDVQNNVVWYPSFWSPGEACSAYARSYTVLSMDNHSPIFALAAGVPTIFLRHATDTIKGQMWPDIGMQNWFFEMDETSSDDVSRCLFQIHSDREAALARVREIMGGVRSTQARSMGIIREKLRGYLQERCKV